MRRVAGVLLLLILVAVGYFGKPDRQAQVAGEQAEITVVNAQPLPPKVKQSADTPAALPVASKPDRWHRREEVSALNDTRSVFWQLEADIATPNSIGRPEKPTMHVMCIQNETRVVFNFNDYMGGMGDATITYRVDKAKAKQRFVDRSEGGKLVGFWNGTGIFLLKEIENAEKLVVGAKPYNEPMRETVFTLFGIKNAIREVRARCKW